MDLVRLEREARTALKNGKKIAAIIATLGTTDAFGLDDLERHCGITRRAHCRVST